MIIIVTNLDVFKSFIIYHKWMKKAAVGKNNKKTMAPEAIKS